jgi:hypothetical protein
LLSLGNVSLRCQQQEFVGSVFRTYFGSVIDVEVMLKIAGLGDLPVEQGMLFLFGQSIFRLFNLVYFHASPGPFVYEGQHIGIGLELNCV